MYAEGWVAALFDHIVSLLRGHFLSKVSYAFCILLLLLHRGFSRISTSESCVCGCAREFEAVGINEGASSHLIPKFRPGCVGWWAHTGQFENTRPWWHDEKMKSWQLPTTRFGKFLHLLLVCVTGIGTPGCAWTSWNPPGWSSLLATRHSHYSRWKCLVFLRSKDNFSKVFH